ncbi:putative dolichyl-P-Man:Man(7)GlcNAc(2)-PP-dolichyl-alpha-1,6-mannosyltransferase [Wickerhamomyces ciferrii]|uniref:Mannosyltransferase n=1 Tax=Wickerhamomyces ciferrii (strain ATCC 14091 / BCRC 22168 / CBS 111 / JCM 3599 / NBRC 0793 / NRRL Y-1031 F-60-10) TaxID=1206466 RepID=K0KHY8_WICCF|nr:putative dolichyl-P-Man:Man(7)GlcNAc(2)-PP-dolichyl-alpha-1,6-mannosyltransferase [Wickerhamomyces ciferrii]CCH44815.1 putative dolichyl-P-Man:Man(7)GlcNAc(2)-PP-dolichyl-alpha-1,6-mannosyltransferase [Wickerhamomyces ciferrii]
MVSAIDSILVVVISVHLFYSPFTKVEESFNIQAIHDHLTYGLDVSQYDHTVFPGAVPRTFLGSLILSILLKPVQLVLEKEITDLDLQILTRGVLGLLNAMGLIILKDSVLYQIKQNDKKLKQKNHHNYINFWFIALTISQFHLIYYSSRTLPNFIVLPLINFAISKIITNDYSTGISILSFATVVFRIELLALTLSLGFTLFVFKKVSFGQLVKSSIIGGVIGILISGGIDSFFWQRPLVPELESFIYNVIDGKSENWGVEPIYTYFTKYLLTIFLPPTVLALQGYGIINDHTGNNSFSILSISSLLYVSIISIQPHKEWRFIVYIIPVLTLVGANGASELTKRASKSIVYKILVLLVFGSSLISFAISSFWLKASSLNYPGGVALQELNGIILNNAKTGKLSNPINVHLDVPACMTGVTLFGEINETPNLQIIYDKTEDFQELSTKWESFDYLITDVSDSSNLTKIKGFKWFKLDSIKGFAGINTSLIKSITPEFLLDLIKVTIKSRNLNPIMNLFNLLFVQQDYLYIYTKVELNSKEHEKIVQLLKNI